EAECDHLVGRIAEKISADVSGITIDALLRTLPEAVYVTDANGVITYYNEAAAELWGTRPEIGKSTFCGSWKLYSLDGAPMAHEACPMAVALRERRPVRDAEAIAERPDGSRITFQPFPTPIIDANGVLLGGVNVLIDLTDRQIMDETAQRYTAIIESSDDA